MIATNFEYHAPESVEAALALLEQYGEDCKILSGGHSLIPVLKLRLASPVAVIDIGRIEALNYIKLDGNTLRIGSLSTHGAIAASPLIEGRCSLLAQTASQIGDQQVRNRGTIGGSLTHADPAADYPASILALDAKIHIRGRSGERVLDASDFFVDMLTSAVQPGEIVTAISVPLPSEKSSGCYLKVPQPASGFAIVGVAVQVEVVDGVCRDARVGITGLSPKPYRATSVERALNNNALDATVMSAAAQLADSEAVDAMGDIYASGEYRRHLARVYTRRALEKATSRF